MLTIARPLMGNPQLLLMDEPTEGLAPLLVQCTAEVIERLASRVYILDTGTVQWSGPMQQLRSRPDILDRYLAI